MIRPILIALMLAGGCGSSAALAQPNQSAGQTSTQLIGSWRLVSRTVQLADGAAAVDSSLGDHPLGILIYDTTGHVALQLARADRSPDIFREECGAVIAQKTEPGSANRVFGYDAYFGTYTIDEKAQILTHHLESALWPANIGTSISRHFAIAGDTLTTNFKTIGQDGKAVTRTLVWQRMR